MISDILNMNPMEFFLQKRQYFNDAPHGFTFAVNIYMYTLCNFKTLWFKHILFQRNDWGTGHAYINPSKNSFIARLSTTGALMNLN